MTARVRPRRVVRDDELGLDYARYSAEKQGSIPEQQAINREVAAEHGIALVASFTDEGVSRSVQEREGLLAMFAYLEASPEIGYVVINELERLTAGISQRAIIVEMCQRLNVCIVTEDIGKVDPFDDEKMHEADQRAVAAKGEVLKVQRRTRRNLRQKVLAGTVAMRPAFGTRMKAITLDDGTELPSGARYIDASGRTVRSGQLEIHPDEIEWLRKIFEWAGEDVAQDEIARRLTQAGVPTKSGRATWRGNTIAGILGNPLYRGEMTWGKQATLRYGDGTTYLQEREADDPGRLTKPSPLGPLVDVALFDAIQQRREARQGERRSVRRTYGPQLFDGLVYCLKCGHKMYGRNGNAGVANAHRSAVVWGYHCSSNRPANVRIDGFGPLCSKPRMMSEKRILEALGSRTADPDVVRVRPVRRGDHPAERRRLERAIEDCDAKYQRAVDLVLDGLLPKEGLKRRKVVLDRERGAIQSKLDALAADQVATAPAAGYVFANHDAWAELAVLLADPAIPVVDRAAALTAVGITRIYVDRPVVELEFDGGHSSVEGGLLRLQDRKRRV